MRSANWITAYAGLLIGGAYVATSLIRGRLDDGEENPTRVVAVEVALVVAAASIAYGLIDRFAPGTTGFRDFSSVGFLSPKALTVWESVALWTGLGALCGLMVPFRIRNSETGGFGGFERGSTGLAPAGALLLLYLPITFFVTLFGWFGTQSVLSRRAAVLSSLGVAVVAEWLLSMIPQTVVRTGWGLIHGPESTLWVLAMAGALAARQSHEPAADGSPVQ